MSRRVKSDAHVPGKGVNFDDSPQPGVLAEKLVKRLLEETDAFVFAKGEKSGPPKSESLTGEDRSSCNRTYVRRSTCD